MAFENLRQTALLKSNFANNLAGAKTNAINRQHIMRMAQIEQFRERMVQEYVRHHNAEAANTASQQRNVTIAASAIVGGIGALAAAPAAGAGTASTAIGASGAGGSIAAPVATGVGAGSATTGIGASVAADIGVGATSGALTGAAAGAGGGFLSQVGEFAKGAVGLGNTTPTAVGQATSPVVGQIAPAVSSGGVFDKLKTFLGSADVQTFMTGANKGSKMAELIRSLLGEDDARAN